MQIIWLTTQFPTHENDTKGSFIFRTVKELSKHYNIKVINLHSILPPVIPIIKDVKNAKRIYDVWRNKYPKKPRAPVELTNKVIYANYFRLPRGIFHFTEGWFGYQAISKFLKDLLKEKSIIHATWLFPEGDLANIVYKKHKVPFVVTLMGSDVHFLKEKSKKWHKAKEIIRNASYITSVSQQLYSDLEKKNIFVPAEKKLLTHTIYEFDKFKILNKKEIRTKLNLSTSDKIIFYAGALREIKNVDVLINAFSQILFAEHEYKNKIKLVIAGKGEEEGRLKTLVNKLRIQDQVNFVGGLNGEEIVKFYNAADVFCLPSKNEGLPNVIVESLLCGTPVVASSVGEIPFIIKNNFNGFVVPAGDKTLLGNNILKVFKVNWDRNKLRESISFLNTKNVLNEYNKVYSCIKIDLK